MKKNFEFMGYLDPKSSLLRKNSSDCDSTYSNSRKHKEELRLQTLVSMNHKEVEKIYENEKKEKREKYN